MAVKTTSCGLPIGDNSNMVGGKLELDKVAYISVPSVYPDLATARLITSRI